MKVSRLFAGVLVVILGIALFLSNFDILHLDWHYIFKLWPVLLVLAGISVLVPNQKWRAVLYALTLVLVVGWIVSAATVGFGRFSDIFEGHGRNVQSQEFTQDLGKGIKSASLSIKAGAGVFTLDDTTSDLFRAKTESDIGSYTFDSDKNGTSQSLDLTFQGKDSRWNFGHSRNTVDLRLNAKPDWTLHLDVGACKVNFDLTPYLVRQATIKAGASSIKVRLGDRADTARVRFETGVSSLVVYVPKNSGCRILDKAELSSKSFPGFEKDGDGLYRSPNFASAPKKIFIEADAGISSIKIERY